MFFKKQTLFSFLFLFYAVLGFGQDHLSASYIAPFGVADNLNICGEPDTVSVRVQLNGSNNSLRSDVFSSIQLFEGVSFIELIEGTSVGVSVFDNSDPNTPILSLPDLSPDGNTFADIYFSVSADCRFTDSLEINEQALVRDSWKFDYNLGDSAFSEVDILTEYRDAFSIPFFTVEIAPRTNPVKVGECFNREIKITNTSLSAYVSEMSYEVTQEIGVIIDDILVNGNSVNFSSFPAGPNANRLQIVLNQSDFLLNESTLGGLGNSDEFFDANEFLTITEVLCFQSCDLGRSSTHVSSWGCGGLDCNETSAVDFIASGLGHPTPNVEVISNIDPGYCGTGSSTLRFSNIGYEDDNGFGAMYDVSTGIGLSGNFLLDLNGYTITAMEIAGISLTGFNALNSLDGHPSFLTDPDGVGGLSDLDNDGYFDDLPVGQSFDVTTYVDFNCDIADVISHPDSCFNNFSTGFNGRIDYTNSCGKRDLRLQSSYYRPTNSNSGFENFADPDAFLNSGIFKIRHIEQRSVRSFEDDCQGGDQLVAKVILPSGISPVLSETELIKNTTSPLDFINSFQNGDTLNLVFGGPLLEFLSGTYELVLAFEADCNSELGPTEFPLIFEFQCPDCDCNHIWFCDELPGPWLHATNPPCPEEVLIDCPVGLQTNSFDVERTTFGFTDNSYNVKYPKSQANLKVAIPCDSVKMSITNVVGDTPLQDSFGIIIGYDNTDNSNSSEETFIFTDGVLTVINNGSTTLIPVTPDVLTVSSTGSQKELRFDFGTLLSLGNLILNPGDSINFDGNFYINPLGPLPFQFRGVPNFRGFGYTIVNNETIYCDKFGEYFTLGKTNSVFDFPNNQDFPKGCNPGELEYRLITVNNGFSNFFGDEIRPATRMDSLVLDFETTIFDAFSDGSVEVLVPGHPIFGNDFYPIKPLSDFPDGRYVALFDTLDYVPALNETGNVNFSLRVNLTPNCTSYFASEDGDNRYRFDSKMTFNDRYYARFIGDGSCMIQRDEKINQDIEYSIPPELEISPVSNTNFTLLGDTAIWVVEICNQSSLSDAGLTWISINNPDDAVEVVSMRDLTANTNSQQLNIQKYGNNYFAFADGILKGSGGNSVEDICNVIEIKALVNICGTSVISASTGWNCEPFPEPDWTPEFNPICSVNSIPLSVSTRDPRLEADIVDIPIDTANICDTNSITVLLKNVDLGAVFDLKTVFTIPPVGASLVPGSVEFAYPSSSNFSPCLSDPNLTSIDTRGQNYEFTGFDSFNSFLQNEGLPGFNQINPSDSNEIKIRFKFLTDCDFVSGSLAYFSFQGEKGCQEPSNFEAGETLPIFLKGASPDPNKLFDIEFTPRTSLVSGRSDIGIIATNLTDVATDANDKIRFTLPENTSYRLGSAVGISPANWVPGNPLIQSVGGVQELIWDLPAGLGLNETAELSLSINTPQYDCDSPVQNAKLATVSQTILMCESAGTPCDIQIITSTGGDDFIVLPVGEMLELSNAILESDCSLGDESIETNLNISTIGFQFNNEQVILNYYYDQNGNAEFDQGELLFSTTKNTPSSGTVWSFSDNFDVEIGKVCDLRIFINPDNLPICQRADFSLPIPILQNAGRVNSICDDEMTITANLGVNDCQSVNYDFLWSAISPADVSMLSSLTDASPIFTTQKNPSIQEYQFIVETTRLGCSGTKDTVSVKVGNPISVTTISPVFIPLGSSVDLTGNVSGGLPPYTYNWSPSDGLNQTDVSNPTASPDSDIQYTLSVSDSLGCTAEAIVRAIVDNPISGSTNFSDTSICFGANVQLLAAGGTDYLWIPDAGNFPPGGLNNLNISNPVFENGVAGAEYIFDLVVSDSNFPGFSDTLEVIIKMGIPVQIDLNPREVIAIGDSVNLNPTIGGGILPLTYNWSPATDLRTPNSSSTIAVPVQNTDYELLVTDDFGCEFRSNVFVEVRPPVQGDVNFSDTTICFGESLQIIASGGTDYEWIPNLNNPNQGELSSESISNPIFQNGIEGATYEYFVSISDNTLPGSFDTIGISISVSDLPEAEAGRDLNVCRGESVVLSGNAIGGAGNFSYSWSSGVNTQTSTITPVSSSFYYLTVTDDLGCRNIDSVFVNVQSCPCDLPVVSDIFIQNSTCGNADGSARIDIAGDINDFIFNWTPSVNLSAPNFASNLTYGRWIVRVTRTRDLDCFIDVPVIISNQTGPIASAVTNPATCTLSDGSVVLSPSDFTFSWPDNTTSNNRNDLAPGLYFPTVTDPSNPDCQNVMLVEIETSNPMSSQIIFNSLPDCGQRNGSVTIQISGTPGPFSYSWQGGSDTRTDLTAGLHFLTVTDLSGNGCELPISFDLAENAADATILINNITSPQCVGANSGGVDYEVSFDPSFEFPADTIITNGFQNFTNGTLPSGNYCIEIWDNNGCLTGSNCFTVNDPEIISVVATSFEECQSLGRINLDVSGGTAPYSFNWEDLNPAIGQPGNRVDLVGGTYRVTVSDSNNCTSETTISVDSCEQCFIISAKDTLLFQATSCNNAAELCLPVSFQRANRLEIIDNGVLYNRFLTPCDLDTIFIYSFRNLYGEGDLGPYILQNWEVNGLQIQGGFDDLSDLVLFMNQSDPGGNWVLNSQNKSISGGNLNNIYSQITASDVALGISSEHHLVVGNPAGGYSLSMDAGFHEIIISDPVEGCFDTIYTNVVCAKTDSVYIDLIVGNSDTVCVSSNELLGGIDVFYNNCEDGTFASYQILNDSCIAVVGDSVGLEQACLVVCDDLNICDTTIVFINITPIPLPQKIVNDTIGVGQFVSVCCDTSEVRLDFPIETIRNVCADSSGVSVLFDANSDTNCLDYTGLEPGLETACIEFCDQFGNCDTVLFIVLVEEVDTIIRDTILINVDSETYCFPRDSFPPIVEIFDDCPDLNGNDVEFLIDSVNLCVSYTGINLGIDTSCIILVANNGVRYRTTFIVDVITTNPETVCDTIYVNEEIVFEIDTTEISGSVFLIDNFCPEEEQNNVDFFFNEEEQTITYEGLSSGTDSACVVFCDERGACDSIYFCIAVKDYLGLPILYCDSMIQTDKNVPVVINVSLNDTLFGNPNCPVIITQPSAGKAFVNADCSIVYVQDEEGACDTRIEFEYEVCNENGCDTACVKIDVKCIDITIFTAVSPNLDGVNDTFYIGGIDDKPDNMLRVYNRWGNLVFEQKSYDNSWTGTFNGKELPDGSYFYIFEVVDNNGVKEFFRGYLELYR